MYRSEGGGGGKEREGGREGRRGWKEKGKGK